MKEQAKRIWRTIEAWWLARTSVSVSVAFPEPKPCAACHDLRFELEMVKQERALAANSALQWMKRCRELEARPAAACLTEPETERLAVLIEECGRAAQSLAMVLRHGWESESPTSGRPNRGVLEKSLGYFSAAEREMIVAGDLRRQEITAWRERRLARRGDGATA